jgi:predicted RNase H-like nuclease
MTRVLGVDGCRTGWAGIVWDGRTVHGVFARRLGDLLAAAGEVDAVVLDMPIGLPDHGVRQADLLAKKELGPKASSIFLTSTRAALHAPTRGEAQVLNHQHGGGGVTAQAFALHAKIAEVDVAVREAGAPVVEGHPELSFARLAGGPVLEPKRSWAGSAGRRALLAGAGIDLDVDLGEVGRQAAVDDVVDAAVLAWTAARVARGEAVSRPDPPEVFSDGWPAAIWT